MRASLDTLGTGFARHAHAHRAARRAAATF
jgi:hypothetical protein